MKKWVVTLLVLLCLLPLCALADEVDVTWTAGKKKVDADVVTDGDDATAFKYSATAAAKLDAVIPEGESVQMVTVRLRAMAKRIELQQMNAKKKWVTVAAVDGPVAECALIAETPITGKLRVRVSYAAKKTTYVTELHAYSDTASAEGAHLWRYGEPGDILLTLDKASDLDAEVLRSWLAEDRSVTVAMLMLPDDLLSCLDTLWDAGLRNAPLFGTAEEMDRPTETILKQIGKKKTTRQVTSWIRQAKPLLLVDGGEVTALVMEDAVANAILTTYEVEDAEENGIWPVPAKVSAEEDVLAALAQVPERSDKLLRDVCLTYLDGAVFTDPSAIAYPPNRDAEGYLTEGEFVHEDPDTGLWAYLSPSLQVEIVQYVMDEKPKQSIFLADVKFKPEVEQFKQHIWVNGDYPTHCIYPQTLAQTSKLVIAINGDYYLYRVNKKAAIGNILRNGKVLYNVSSKASAWPCLETMALHDDGRISVYGAREVTADELLAMGDVHDALSFGPYTARNGELRVYSGKYYNVREPRTAIGMISPGHYVILCCEGRIPDDGAVGMTVNETGRLLYGLGCTDAFLLDGGNTQVLTFLGRQLNRNGLNTYIGSPRNQHELFGVGTTELVHTDWVKGKPKK